MIIPEDKIESGAGVRKWVYAHLYGATDSEVIEKVTKYYQEYPPQGYDTHMDMQINKSREGYWQARIRRYSSCD